MPLRPKPQLTAVSCARRSSGDPKPPFSSFPYSLGPCWLQTRDSGLYKEKRRHHIGVEGKREAAGSVCSPRLRWSSPPLGTSLLHCLLYPPRSPGPIPREHLRRLSTVAPCLRPAQELLTLGPVSSREVRSGHLGSKKLSRPWGQDSFCWKQRGTWQPERLAWPGHRVYLWWYERSVSPTGGSGHQPVPQSPTGTA